jgi:hypothetical protein
MEGSYMTQEQRLKLAQQISKTSINLSSGKGDYATTSYSFFQPKHAQSSTPDTRHIRDIKASHFQLGSGSAYRSQSEFSARYPQHPDSAAAVKKSQKEIQEIRRHSVTLGNHKDSYATTSLVSFQANSAPVDGKQLLEVKQQMTNLRKHNYKFGDDPATLKSVFKQEYDNLRGATIEKAQQTKLKEELGKSHFVVGNSPMYYQSTAVREYGQKTANSNAEYKELKRELAKEHFVLGDSRTLLATTSQTAFTCKEGGRQDLNKEKLNNLRSSHFTLGNEKISYAPISKTSTTKETRSISIPPTNSQSLRKTNFVLGSDEVNWSTTHQNTHYYSNNIPRSIPRDSNADRSSNLILGTEAAPPVSTNQAIYRPTTSTGASKLDPKLNKELRGHHFKLGTDQKFYATTNSFYGAGKGEPSKLDPNLRKELGNSHFVYGNEPVPKISSVQKDYKPVSGGPEPANKHLAKNLRSSHFKLGNDSGMWNTNYKGNFTGVKPVPEKDWPFSK